MASGGKGDRALAAAVYGGTTVFSWGRALRVPALQAAANILVLKQQEKANDKIFDRQRSIVDAGLARYCTCLTDLLPLFQSAYDDVPEAAEYVPLDPTDIVRGTIRGNLENLPDADTWAQCVSRLNQQNDVIRAISLDPRYVQSADLYSRQVNDMLRGHLTQSSTMNIMTDVAETACLHGKIGGVQHATARGLGIGQFEIQRQGRQEFREWMSTLNRDVSPLSRQGDVRTMARTPQEAVQLALTEAQLIQNSLQNVFNARAKKPPHLLAELQVLLDKCVNTLQTDVAKASMQNTFTPNFAAALQPQIQAAAQVIGGGQSGSQSPQVNESAATSPAEGGNTLRQNGVTPNNLVDLDGK